MIVIKMDRKLIKSTERLLDVKRKRVGESARVGHVSGCLLSSPFFFCIRGHPSQN